MSNRQQRRAVQKPNPIVGAIGKLIEEGKSRSEAQDSEEEQEDLNILPFPEEQVLMSDEIRWAWNPIKGVKVMAFYFGATNAFHVEMLFIKPTSCLEPEESKLLGQALVSAWNWENVWQQHVGTFLQRAMVKKAVDTTFDNGSKDDEPQCCCNKLEIKLGKEECCGQCYNGEHSTCVGPLVP